MPPRSDATRARSQHWSAAAGVGSSQVPLCIVLSLEVGLPSLPAGETRLRPWEACRSAYLGCQRVFAIPRRASKKARIVQCGGPSLVTSRRESDAPVAMLHLLQAQPIELFLNVPSSVPLTAWLPTGHCLCALGGCRERPWWYNARHYMVKAVHKHASTRSPIFRHSLSSISAAPVQIPHVQATPVCCALAVRGGVT